MGCRTCCLSHKLFIFVNIAFAMYAGALLSTAARLAWDPSTYTWFRWLLAAQYRVSAAYVLAAGLALAALVALAAASPPPPVTPRRHRRLYHLYAGGVLCLALSEVCYAAWMGVTLVRWWREAPQAELARRGLDLVHDLKPALLAVERYRDIARPVYQMIEEMEREAPNNVFVIIVFSFVGAVLQVLAFVLARRLGSEKGAGGGEAAAGGEEGGEASPLPGKRQGGEEEESEGGAGDTAEDGQRERDAPGWRKTANLKMYTILDKIF